MSVSGHRLDAAAKVGGYTLRLRGLNPLIAAISTPTSAPLVAGTRLRGGTAASARGAASFVAEAIGTARAAGATGLLVVRMDSAFYNAATIAACRRGGARFSVTARMDPKIRRAIAAIPEHAWTRSATRTRSWTTTSNGGSPTPRSPRSTTPRSPARSRR